MLSGYGNYTAHAIPADYDSDGKADLSVKTDDGNWFIDYAANGFGRWDLIIPAQTDPLAVVMTEFWSIESANSPSYNTSPYNPQYTHLVKAQNFFTNTLMVPSRSFGAPFNRTDKNTEVAMSQISDIAVWMCYAHSLESCFSTSKRILWFSTLIESWAPSYSFDDTPIRNNWSTLSQNPYLVIQIHPAAWDQTNMGMDKFLNLIAFLKAKGVTFMTPYNYANTIK
jgi:peptidoglycan/xylan/chitin deacetylase (PgdA/CDA1 family)